MEMRPELSPEMQIFLIAQDVEEVKQMIKGLEGTVAEVHIAMVGSKDRPGVFEELRLLSQHKHPEIDSLRTEMRIFIAQVGASVAAVVTVVTIGLRFWPTH